MSRARLRTAAGWHEAYPHAAALPQAPEAQVGAVRSSIREKLSPGEVQPAPATGPEANGRQQARTIMGVTGVGGGNGAVDPLPTEDRAQTVYGGLAAEHAAADFELFANAISMLAAAGLDRELARMVVVGEVPKEDVEAVRALLLSKGVDEKTTLAVLWGVRIQFMPVITPPAAPALPPVEPKVDGGGVEIDSDYRKALDDVQDPPSLIVTGTRWKMWAALAGVGIALAGAGYAGFSAISNNLQHSSHTAPRR